MSFPSLLAFYPGEEMVTMAQNSGWVARGVLLVLGIASLFSWAVIYSKWSQFKRARVQSGRFLRAFRKASKLSEIATVSDQFKPSPLVAVLDGAVGELKRQNAGVTTTTVQRAMQIASSEELTLLESRVSILATIGATAPFIGLFGTVWGIIDAFHGLGTAGAATLRAVAPGISEALITTAFGLFAAIPAVVAYNSFSNKLKEFAARMDDFSLEMLNTMERDNSREQR
jgi:biopolymer transport protein TolQ